MGEVGRLNLLRGEKEKGLYMINHRQKDNVLAPQEAAPLNLVRVFQPDSN